MLPSLFNSRAVYWRLGFFLVWYLLFNPTAEAQLEVVNGLSHKYLRHHKVDGWIEVLNRSAFSETAIVTVAPLRPKNAPPLDTLLVGYLEIARSCSVGPGEKKRIPFKAELPNREKATGCMVYVEPAVSLEYQWKHLTDSIGLVTLVRYGVAVLAAGDGPSDTLVQASAFRDSTGIWLELSNRSEALWMPRALWSERGRSVQKNEWVILPGENKKIKWKTRTNDLGKLVVLDNDRRRWQWNL
jgi:hypothetical protein